jgi:hypothetical protein
LFKLSLSICYNVSGLSKYFNVILSLFSGAEGTLVLIVIMYGISTIPFSYIVSFLAKTPASGFTMSIIVNILAGCIAPIAAYILKGRFAFFLNNNPRNTYLQDVSEIGV